MQAIIGLLMSRIEVNKKSDFFQKSDFLSITRANTYVRPYMKLYNTMNRNASYQAEKLLKLALRNKSERIYQILNNIKGSSTYKGDVFEHFLAGLYNGIGWKALVHGGKGDKGVDILLYHQSRPSQVHTIIQAKNTKTRLSKKDLRHEYANFFGDDFSSSQGASEKFQCKIFIIISLNGYTENTLQLTHPKIDTHQVSHYTWNEIQQLIENYSQKQQFENISRHKKTVIKEGVKKGVVAKKAKKKVFLFFIILSFIILISSFRPPREEIEVDILTNEMIERLHETKLTAIRKQDCKNWNYSLETCPEALIYRYRTIYGDKTLKTALVVYFCGQGHFKKGKCRAFEKKALYVLT